MQEEECIFIPDDQEMDIENFEDFLDYKLI